MKKKFPKYEDVIVSGRLKFILKELGRYRLKGKILLDIGSSSGLIISTLTNRGLKKIIGVEPDEDAVNFAKKNVKGATFYLSSAESMPIDDQSVDIAVMFDVIEHVPKDKELVSLKKVGRVLKKKGLFLLTTPNNHYLVNILDPAWYFGHRHYTLKKIKSLAERAGLKVRRTEVKGTLWSSIYMLWFYIAKWIFGVSQPRNLWLESKDDAGFDKKRGIFTILIEAGKA